ncbi:MAG: NUDIX domain-containing protein [Thermodesulfobacteriota bacterium]
MQPKIFCHYCGNRLVRKYVEGGNRLFCETCRAPIYENPVPATSLVVTDAENRVLLVKRDVEPKKGYWCLPGGFIELGEPPDLAALRELREETGLNGQIDKLLGVTADTSDRYGNVLMIGYLVKCIDGSPAPGDDAAAVAYFRPEKLPEIAFSSHRYILKVYYGSVLEQGDNPFADTGLSDL